MSRLRHAALTQDHFKTALWDTLGEEMEVTPTEGGGVLLRLTIGNRVAWRVVSGGDLSSRTLAAVSVQAGRLLGGGRLPDAWTWE